MAGYTTKSPIYTLKLDWETAVKPSLFTDQYMS